MTARTFARCFSALALALGLASCLPTGKVTPPPDKCSCTGVYCLNGNVTKRSPAPDNGEGDDPCLTCESTTIGVCDQKLCAEESDFDVQGCPVAYACKSWDRVAAGKAPCAIDRDCEPGQGADGKPNNRLACRDNVCTDVGDEKFKEVVATACATKTFGASAYCDGRACLGQDEYSKTFTCSAARCIDSSDCPTGWHCRCAEEYLPGAIKGWRWCVPDVPAGTDAGE
ncbi:MAG TPA: hypothetical protein VGK67_26265 [Myxococcales bacterium]|jgi:hypothetical protein